MTPVPPSLVKMYRSCPTQMVLVAGNAPADGVAHSIPTRPTAPTRANRTTDFMKTPLTADETGDRTALRSLTRRGPELAER